MDLRGSSAVVVGLGRSGVAAANLLLDRGARVVGSDGATRDELSAAAIALEGRGATLSLGGHDPALFAGVDRVVVSPGVPSFPALEAFEQSGREVIGEMELASRCVTAPIVLIGGTNGKSTTTALIGEMLAQGGKRVFVGGNFGIPLAEVVDQAWDFLVLEISSFQAERVPTLHARAHALLNITDDHLDRYPSFDAYAHAKGNPFARMGSNDLAVIPRGDALCAREAARGAARVLTFSAADPAADVALVGDALLHRPSGHAYPASLLKIAGKHNLENACAAIAVAVDLGVTPEAIERTLASFTGLGHRNVLVGESDGIRYYDDSKGTNVGASVAALRGIVEERAVLIAGGRDKLGDYAPLVAALRDKGRALVLIGEAAARIEEAARGALPIARAGSMPEAVRIAREFARSRDCVLLSPACSSFDMFLDYKERGDVFAQAVRDLIGEKAADLAPLASPAEAREVKP
jgi:UDP-N-acetylmuramoylalanine--D-glutamate ligase